MLAAYIWPVLDNVIYKSRFKLYICAVKRRLNDVIIVHLCCLFSMAVYVFLFVVFCAQAPLEADLSSKVGVLQLDSGPLNDLQLREQRITQLSNKVAIPDCSSFLSPIASCPCLITLPTIILFYYYAISQLPLITLSDLQY